MLIMISVKTNLEKYGYFDCYGPLPMDAEGSPAEVRKAIESMQRFAGLPVTGEIDEETAKMMNRPRCGVKDINPHGRYVLAGDEYKWTKNYLYYR